ncbi:MAG TPA: hypothetical protein VGP72_20365 [Planctomycetota bacterium]|jgi:hypothetical protein
MTKLLVRNRTLTLKPEQAIGKGGEADVYDIGGGMALKLFKTPNHPDLALNPNEQRAAADRLAEHQRKLREFPTGLPERVVAPLDLATDSASGMIAGYTMRLLQNAEVLLRYGEPLSRQNGVRSETIVSIFRDLHATLTELHKRGIVVGDFNDLNVLVKGLSAYLIDADSLQFGPYLTRVFTERFVDPLLCDPGAERLTLCRPFVPASDWHAFNVMLFRSLLLVEPYGGIYKPKDAARKIPQTARALRRITVFEPEVIYPKVAVRYDVLSDALLQYFHGAFKRDQRGAFPVALLENLIWSVCPKCGAEHARKTCPLCEHATPMCVREVVQIRGKVKITRILQSDGTILHASAGDGVLRWLANENGAFKREDGRTVFTGQPSPAMRFALTARTTWIGSGQKLIGISHDSQPRPENVDACGGRPQFACAGDSLFWLRDGCLMRQSSDGPNIALGPESIGTVLPQQTTFWVGRRFGFGFYRAGQLGVAFVFGTRSRGLNDSVKLPPLNGQLVSASCTFAEERCWVFLTLQQAGQLLTHTLVVNADGNVEASELHALDEAEWLAGVAGACATNKMLLVPTDEGLVRIELDNGRIVQTRTFPDTEPFVDTGSRLILARDGLYIVGSRSISRLDMEP